MGIYKVVLLVDKENLSKVVNDEDYEIKKVDQMSGFLLGNKKRISKTNPELRKRFDRYQEEREKRRRGRR